MRILLLVYACQPEHGSEPKNGWQWASRLAQQHEVHLLTHARGRQAIEEKRRLLPEGRLHVHYVELPEMLDPWTHIHPERLVRLRYVLWQIAAYRKARELANLIDFDLVHHVTWGSVAGLTLGWALDLPFVWGPIGGGQTAPLRMYRVLGVAGTVRECIRNLRVATIGSNIMARVTARKCAVALTANLETRAVVERLGARCVRLMLDTAVDPDWLPASMPDRSNRPKPVVLWAGRLEAHKALNLAIQSFARALPGQDAEMWVLGDGPLRSECEQLAERLGVARAIRFLGWVPYKQMPELLRAADVFVFTSLRDSCPQPVLEALGWGLPVVSLDHQGLRLMPDSAVMKVKVTTPESVVDDLGNSIRQLLESPGLRYEMGRSGWTWIREYHLWSRRVEAMIADVYAECTEDSMDMEHAAGV